ncbi:hypothetical protein C0991_006212, partial [Blastosporella zonata]
HLTEARPLTPPPTAENHADNEDNDLANRMQHAILASRALHSTNVEGLGSLSQHVAGGIEDDESIVIVSSNDDQDISGPIDSTPFVEAAKECLRGDH